MGVRLLYEGKIWIRGPLRVGHLSSGKATSHWRVTSTAKWVSLARGADTCASGYIRMEKCSLQSILVAMIQVHRSLPLADVICGLCSREGGRSVV